MKKIIKKIDPISNKIITYPDTFFESNKNIKNNSINKSVIEEYNVYNFVQKTTSKNSNFSNIKPITLNFEVFSDKQNTLLTQLSYLNFETIKVNDYINKNGSITLSNLKKYLVDGNKGYLGNLGEFAGVSTTGYDLLDELINNGLGDLKVISIANDDKNSFNAIVFEDQNGNRGFSFRGTDTTSVNDLIYDSYIDTKEYISGINEHTESANQLFNKYKNNIGNNYLFGHSLAGNTVYHVFMKNNTLIKKGFMINTLPLGETNTKHLQSIEIDGRLVNIIIEGDWVSKLKEHQSVDGVKYVVVKSNNDYMFDHIIESATFDNGNFVHSDNNINDEMENINVVYKILYNIRGKSSVAVNKIKTVSSKIGSELKNKCNSFIEWWK